MAWQFDLPEKGEGVIQAFRREQPPRNAPREASRLGSHAAYVLANFDVPGSTEMSGSELMEKGLTIPIKEKPGAVVIWYVKKR